MFDTVYAEEAAFEYEATRRILGRLKRFAPEGKITVVPVRSAGDVAARRGQDFGLQRANPKLILAVNRGPFIFEGSRNCQDFGADAFYYCSAAVNCIGRCRYCYLSGASRSANLTVFVNTEDCFAELEALIAENSRGENGGKTLLIPVSYDNDVYALEGLLGYVKEFADLAVRCRKKGLEGFTLEVRTKCGTKSFLDNIDPAAAENMVFTWSVAPRDNIRLFEPATSPLKSRLDAAEYALKKGFGVRLSFDPVLALLPSWREDYAGLIDEIERRGIIPLLDGAGVGGFRVPADYLKTMRKNDPAAAPLFDIYHESGGTLGYSPAREEAVTGFVKSRLADAGLAPERIFTTRGAQNRHGTQKEVRHAKRCAAGKLWRGAKTELQKTQPKGKLQNGTEKEASEHNSNRAEKALDGADHGKTNLRNDRDFRRHRRRDIRYSRAPL